MDGMPCTVMVPAAGDSVRYRQHTSIPKGLIVFRHSGQYATMVDHVVPKGLRTNVMVGALAEHAKEFKRRLPKHWNILSLSPTSGQAETVWQMAHEAPLKLDLLVVNCDNAFSEGTLEYFLKHCRERDTVCGALVFSPSENPERYGYVNDYPNFSYGAEKVAISKHALAGAFYFQSPAFIIRHGSPNAHYISEWFFDMPKPKLAYQLFEDEVWEWGTAEDLIKSVGNESIVWEP